MPKNTKKIEFKKGDLVFAKLKGYPFWPAKIESLETSEKSSHTKYKIMFYGSYETNILKADALAAYDTESIAKYGGKKKLRNFNEAMWEIENDPDLKKLNRSTDEDEEAAGEPEPEVEKTSEEDDNAAADEDDEKDDVEVEEGEISTHEEEEEEDEHDQEPSEDEIEKKSKSKRSHGKKEEAKKSDKKTARDERDTKKRTTDSDDCVASRKETTTKSSGSSKKSKLKPSVDSPPPQTIKQEKNDEDEDVKGNKARKKAVAQMSSSSSSSFSDSSFDEDTTKQGKPKPETKGDKKAGKGESSSKKPAATEKKKTAPLPSDDTASKSAKSEAKLKADRLKRRKERNMLEKKMAIVRSVRIQLALLRMDFEIKKSLKVDNTDVNRCCLLMEDLIKLPFSKSHLLKAPEIVETIRKCRKFKSSERVCEKAKECFSKFLKIMGVSSSETFLEVFDRERAKFLKENDERLKQERSIAYKLMNQAAQTSR